MLQKEITLDSPILLGAKEDGTIVETNIITLREPTAGNLRGLSLKALLADSKGDDWIIFLSRITQPAIPKESFDIMPLKTFALLVNSTLGMIVGEEIKGKEEQTEEDATQKI